MDTRSLHATRAAVLLSLLLSPAAASAEDEPARRPVELYLGLGPGSAVCDNKKPDSQCPVDGGFTFALGGGWRVFRPLSFGLELGAWSYKVRDSWRGQLTSEATDVKLSSSYIALTGRWYWLALPSVDAHLQFGAGPATFTGEASNASGTYDVKVSGVAFPLGLGAEAYLSSRVRLGGQALAYLQKSSRVCETVSGSDEACKSATADQNALPWRISLLFTVMLGGE